MPGRHASDVKTPSESSLTFEERTTLERHGHRVPERLDRDEADYWRMTAQRLRHDDAWLTPRRVVRPVLAVAIVIAVVRAVLLLITLGATAR